MLFFYFHENDLLKESVTRFRFLQNQLIYIYIFVYIICKKENKETKVYSTTRLMGDQIILYSVF